MNTSTTILQGRCLHIVFSLLLATCTSQVTAAEPGVTWQRVWTPD